MATAKLVGADDASGSNDTGNYEVLTRFQAIATGKITEFRVKAGASAQVKVAVYADNSGSPGALLSYNNTAQNVVSGWNTLSIPSLDVTSGTYYWLAVAMSANGASQCVLSGSYNYKAITFSSFTWPDPADATSTYAATTLVAGWGILVLSPSSIIQPVSYGTPTVSISGIIISPQGIAVIISYGTPTVITAQIIYPTSAVQPISIGTPALLYPQILLPSSIVQAIVYGTPSVGIVGQAGYIYPQSIVQLVSIGSPTILKYVWHVILDGQYATETPGINRAYIIGRDQYGNPVYGEAIDSTELGLVGERLDFTQELAIPTTAQAADVASAILAKMRLTTKRGVILIPPNCGQELFDVVQISDAGANQSAVTFRVVGIRFEYNPKQARYQHKLILGAP